MVKMRGLVIENQCVVSQNYHVSHAIICNSDYSADMKTKKKHKEDICDSIFLDLRDSKLKLV